MNKSTTLILSILIFIFSGISSEAGDNEWLITLKSTVEITAFKLTEGNTAILLGITDTNPVTKKEVYKVLKLGLPNGNQYWIREYPRPIAEILSTSKEEYFEIEFYWIEGELNITKIIDKEGKIIASFIPREEIEQRKVFLINDSYFVTAIDPGGGECGDEYLEKFSTVMEIRSLPGNKLIRSIDIKGELIDAVPWGTQGVRMIVSMSKGKVPPFPEPWYRDQELLQSRDIVRDPIRKIGDVSKGVARRNLRDFFIDDNIIVSESYGLHKEYALRVSQDRITRVPVEFIRSGATMPDDILYFKKYYNDCFYFLNQGGNRVIEKPFNEDIKTNDPFNFLKKYSGESERIELRRSAFYRIGKETFFLKIPKKERNKIVIRKVE